MTTKNITSDIKIIKPLDPDVKQHQYFLCKDDNHEIILSLKTIIDNNIDTTFHESKRCFDHLGIIYNNRAAMYNHYQTDKSKVKYRLRHGYSLENALTVARIDNITDHTGKSFQSMNQMCKHWGVNHATYQSRIDAGWSQKDALTTPKFGSKITKDHLGNSFKSEEQLCKHYRINPTILHKRLSKKWSLEKTLTTPVKHRPKTHKIKDHLGQEFNSLVELANHYDIPYSRIKHGLKHNWSIEKILTDTHNNEIADHLGNVFANKKELCKYWQISYGALKNRLKKGKTMQQALTEPMDISSINRKIKSDYKITKCISHPFYLVVHDNHEIIMSYNTIAKQLYTQILQKGKPYNEL